MPRPVHFEIHAADPTRAITFYEELFGWQFSKVPGSFEYWFVRTGPDGEPGIDGGLIRRKGELDGEAVIAWVCTVRVEDLGPYLTRVAELGATVVVPKTALPGIGWIAYAKDTEGNVFGLHEPDPHAGG